MLTKLLASVVVAVALAGATGGTASWSAKADCCSALGGCCQPPRECCFADCCSAGADCCNPPSDCCLAAKVSPAKADCCAAGAACCTSGDACCFAAREVKKSCCAESGK